MQALDVWASVMLVTSPSSQLAPAAASTRDTEFQLARQNLEPYGVTIYKDYN